MALKETKKNRRLYVTAVVVCLLIVAGLVFYVLRVGNMNNTNSKPPAASTKPATNKETTSTPKTNNNSQTDKEKALIDQGGNDSQGEHSTDGTGITDTYGSNVTTQNNGARSSSGNITLYSPQPNEKLATGLDIKGAAKIPLVQYRISNPIQGQIAQGVLSVHNGFFSGTLTIQGTDAKTGTFEVYNFNEQGQEVDNVKIEITY